LRCADRLVGAVRTAADLPGELFGARVIAITSTDNKAGD
jgi:hypothetical protein